MRFRARGRGRLGTTVAATLSAVLATALTTVVTVLPGSTAHAAEPVTAAAAGPIDPNTGYPLWYADATGEKYELCFDRPNTASGLCLAAPENPQARPWVDEDPAKSNLAADPETFWFNAEAEIADGGVRARFVVAQEATFGGASETATAGEQIAFGRVRVRLNGMVPGASYTVTHPYGSDTYVADDRGRVAVTEDIGCFDLPCDFTKPYDSSVTSYLRWDPAVGPQAPAGYVGDPNVPHQVVGAPAGTNFFRVVGPAVAGAGAADRTLETDLFSVQGKLWNPTQPMLGMVSTRNVVDFGKVAPGATVPTQRVTLTNAGGGNAPLRLQTLRVSGADASRFALSNDSCSGTQLAAGQTCTVDVLHTPGTAVGTVRAHLEVPSVNGKDAAGGQHIALQGRVSDGTGKDARVTGPISAEHGYPQWYQDETGTRLAFCDDQNDPMCVLPDVVEGSYNPAAPMSFPANFPSELFWWTGEAEFESTNTASDDDVTAHLVLAQEAAFLNEEPVPGEQIAFGRIRIRVDGLVLGRSYHVTTPYGDYDLVAEDDGDGGGEINYTEDLGCLETPCNFDRVNQSNIGPFLRQVNAPAGYLGDPNVEAQVTGGPNGNVFAVSGAGVNGETDLFAVSGKVLAGPGGGNDGGSGAGELQASDTTARVTPGQPAAITVTNIGQSTVTPQVSLPAGTGFTIVNNGCTQPLAPRAFCTVTVGLGDVPASPGASTQLRIGGGAQDLVVTVQRAGGGNPAPTAPALSVASDTGLVTRDSLTRLGAVTVAGAAATGQAVEVSVDGAPATTVQAVAGTFSAQLNLTEGRHEVAASYVDGQPAAETVTVRVDTTAPTVAQPQIEAAVTAGSLNGTVSWSGGGTGGGAASFQAQVSRDGGAFSEVALPRPRATRAAYPMASGHRYRFRVRPIDRAGNVGSWAAASVRASLLQERADSVQYAGRWTRPRLTASGDRVRSSASRGATATVRARARAVQLVALTGPKRGRAAVFLNGRRVQTVDLYTPRPRRPRTVVSLTGLSSQEASVVEIRVLDRKRPASGGTKVTLDSFIVIR